jgi:hypothetical protein
MALMMIFCIARTLRTWQKTQLGVSLFLRLLMKTEMNLFTILHPLKASQVMMNMRPSKSLKMKMSLVNLNSKEKLLNLSDF